VISHSLAKIAGAALEIERVHITRLHRSISRTKGCVTGRREQMR
jgi:hypothetical protein